MGARDEPHGHDPGDPHTPAGLALQPCPKSRKRGAAGCAPCSRSSTSLPLPTFDDPAPQMVEQLPDVLQFFDALIPDPDQVIEVPKILPENVPLRAVLRDTQLVEQLVEVPTIFSHASLAFLQVMQRIVEQNVDIPVVGGSGAGGGLSGFLPGQHYSMTAEQIVDIPVPRPCGAGGLQGLPRGQGSTAFSEQIADPDGGLQDFQPVQGSRSVFFGFSWTSW